LALYSIETNFYWCSSQLCNITKATYPDGPFNCTFLPTWDNVVKFGNANEEEEEEEKKAT